MAEPPDFDPPDEAMYRAFDTWELEQMRRATLMERDTKRSPTGEPRDFPAAHYDTRIALIDRLLAERGAEQQTDG